MDKLIGWQAVGQEEGREQFMVLYKDETKQHKKGYIFSDVVVPVEVMRDLVNPGQDFGDDRT